jgi:ABC-type Na+ efflux pump permease subunit
VSALAGAARYEFWMQVRRRAMWVTLGLFGLLVFTGYRNPWDLMRGDGPFAPGFLRGVVAEWAFVVQAMMPIAFGVLLADRLPRDRRTRVAELLATLPGSGGGRLIGKCLGAALATMVPILLMYVAGVGYALARSGDWGVVPVGVAAFALINLPGLLFVAAFSIACTAVLWPPLYQFLFVGYWFWGNLLGPRVHIPSLSGTLLTPVGEYPASAFFGIVSLTVQDAAAWEGLASIGLLLGLAALALWCAHRYLAWQAARR